MTGNGLLVRLQENQYSIQVHSEVVETNFRLRTERDFLLQYEAR